MPPKAAHVKQEPSADGSAAPESAASASGSSPDKPTRERKRRLDVNPNLILSSEGRSKRRRTPSPAPPPAPDPDHDPEKAKTLGLQLYTKITNMYDRDGDEMAQPFVKLPSKRSFPDYYETIKQPMSLEMVKERLEAGQYGTLKEVCKDLGQIWNNAKRYNMHDSLLFQWAKQFHKVTRQFLQTHSGDEEWDSDGEGGGGAASATGKAASASGRASTGRPSHSRGPTMDAEDTPNATAGPSTPGESPATTPAPEKKGGTGTGKKRGSYMKDGPTVYKLIKPCMRAIKEGKSNDGADRDIATIFLSLPDRNDFPDYYRTVKHPISLAEIENKMMSRRYDTADHFFADVERMCDNAIEYNEDESEVWRDARQIRGVVNTHRLLVKERLALPNKGMKNRPSYTPTPAAAPVRQYTHAQAHTPTTAGGAGAGRPVTPGNFQLPPEIRYAQQAQHAQQLQLQQQRAQQAQAQAQQQAQIAQHAQHAQHAKAQGSPYSYGGPPGQHTPSQAQPSVPYLPQLPPGVVTEEVVASLDRYPAYEQQAWVASLPPLAQTIYRQMVTANEARKRGVAPPTPSAAHAPVPEPPSALTNPTVHHIDFAFSDEPETSASASRNGTSAAPVPGTPASASAVLPPSTPGTAPAPARSLPRPRNAIRLQNMRGVLTHAVAVGARTSHIELTAWMRTENGSPVEAPELSLRVNGTPAPLPQVLYGPKNGAKSGVDKGGKGTQGDEGDNGEDKDKSSDDTHRRPEAMRWTVPLPAARVECKIEVVATKPGALAETSAIFVSRQY